MTEGRLTSTSAYPSTYNNSVNTQAKLNPDLPDSTWHALVYVPSGRAAKDNAPSGGLPVYNTLGILVAPADAGLYRLSLLSPILYDQFGVVYDPGPGPFSLVWTGSNWRGE